MKKLIFILLLVSCRKSEPNHFFKVNTDAVHHAVYINGVDCNYNFLTMPNVDIKKGDEVHFVGDTLTSAVLYIDGKVYQELHCSCKADFTYKK